MTDLADKLLAEHRHVGMYPISEDSFEGEFEEMHRMEENRIGNPSNNWKQKDTEQRKRY